MQGGRGGPLVGQRVPAALDKRHQIGAERVDLRRPRVPQPFVEVVAVGLGERGEGDSEPTGQSRSETEPLCMTSEVRLPKLRPLLPKNILLLALCDD